MRDRLGATAEQEFSIRSVTFDLDLDAADDASGASASARDGVIALRRVLGLGGRSLLVGQSDGSIRAHESALQVGIDSDALDVDADEDVDGVDGILIVRYLSGLRGDGLFAGLSVAVAARAAVLGRIDDLLPGG